VPDGTGTWREDAVRDFAMSVGHFALASTTLNLPDPVEVTVGVDYSIGESAQHYLDLVVAALEDFSARFGPYPWPVLTLALTPELPGGIEMPTHIMQGPGTDDATLSHEVGHMWFYSLVGDNQAVHPWLDEGLATYADATHPGPGGGGYELVDPIPPAAQGHAGESLEWWRANAPGSYYEGVYEQGAQAVASLGERWLADCALRHHVAKNAYGIATPEDFFEAIDVVFPDAETQLDAYGL
jgi:aminopeptidase N